MNEVLPLLLRIRPDVQLAVGVVIAAIVTVHVLLTKREVAAAVGWIGLAWFSPFLGGVTYFVLGINRVRRRARRLRGQAPRPARTAAARVDDDGHLRALRQGIGFITARSCEPGNTLDILHNGDAAYPAMLAAIAAAHRSIGLSSYIMRADTIGMRFIEALRDAQQRGVEVRVIVDGIGSGWVAWNNAGAVGMRTRANLP